MAGRQAKTLSPDDINDLLVYASCTRHPLRNSVIVLLSAKAGLRAGEIANLTWDMLVDGNATSAVSSNCATRPQRNAAAGQFPFILTSPRRLRYGGRWLRRRDM